MTGRYEVRAVFPGTAVAVVHHRTNDREEAKEHSASVRGWVLDTQTGEVFAPSIQAWVRREDANDPGMKRLLAAVMGEETTGSWAWRSES